MLLDFNTMNPAHKRLTEVDWQILTTEPYGFYVEVGTNHGASACAAASKADRVVTIDIFDWQPKVWDETWPELSNKITFFKGTSLDYAKELPNQPSIDVLFIDGAHEYEYVTMDCEALVPHVKPGGTILFHDHNPNNPITRVYEAVNTFLAKVPHQAFDKIPGSSNLLKIKKF